MIGPEKKLRRNIPPADRPACTYIPTSYLKSLSARDTGNFAGAYPQTTPVVDYSTFSLL